MSQQKIEELENQLEATENQYGDLVDSLDEANDKITELNAALELQVGYKDALAKQLEAVTAERDESREQVEMMAEAGDKYKTAADGRFEKSVADNAALLKELEAARAEIDRLKKRISGTIKQYESGRPNV